MKKVVLLMFALLLGAGNWCIAQPFFQLEPKSMYKEDLKLTPADWAGFYKTYRKELMIIVPASDSSITGIYTYNYSNGLLVGTLKGTLKGNGVEFEWNEALIGSNEAPESGNGFMIMKENRKDVYLKHGTEHTTGNYTAGKKKEIEIDGKLNNEPWLGKWSVSIYEQSTMTAERYDDALIGYYTLQGYKSTDVFNGWNKTTITTHTMPDRTVLMLGFGIGNKLYYLSNNYVEDDIKTGVITMSDDQKSFTGQEVRSDQLGVKWKNGFTGKRISK